MSLGFGFGFPHRAPSGAGLSPRLYLDFVGTNSLPSTVTFSRGTNATLTDSNGRIAWAPHNLLTNSEDFEAAAWSRGGVTVTSNAITAPDGTVTADALVEDGTIGTHRIFQSVTTTSPPTFSVYAKAGTRSWLQLQDLSGTRRAWFDLSNGALGTVNAGVTASITAVGGGWYRCVASINTTSTIYLIEAATADGVTTYTGVNGTTALYIWGAQLNIGSTAQSYNPTTPKNLLGFTQEPENAAWTKSNSYVQQNLLTWSQDFDNAAWVKNAVTVSANTATAPDGTVSADVLTSSGDGRVTGTATASANTAYTGSVWLRVQSGTLNVTLFRNDNGTGFSSTPVTVTTTWQRFTATATTSATATAAIFQIGGGGSFPNGAVLEVWGAQLVQGSTAGDYTQTTSAAAPTRYLNWDGTLTGRKLVEDATATVTHFITVGTTTVASGVAYTASVFAKASERSWIRLADTAFANTSVYFNVLSGTVGTVGAAVTSFSITSVGNGWYRCSITYTTTTTGSTVRVNLASADNTIVYTGDGTSGIYVSDFQLSNSASVDPYVYNPQAAAASAAYYGPRFDYNPTTLAANGLLIEEQRTNLLTYSEQFDNAAWDKVALNTTGTPPWVNVTTAPDGTTTADKLIEDGTNASHYVRVTLTKTAAAITYTLTTYAKASERSWCLLQGLDAGGGVNAWFNLSTGVKGTLSTFGTGFVGIDSSVTPVGNGWYRCAVAFTTTANTTAQSRIYPATADNISSYQGDGTSGIFIWGAQLEAGSFATSYIPTVASQVTRNADSASMLGDNFYTWYNVNQGSWSSEFATTNTGNAWVFAVTTSAGQHDLVKGPTTVNYRYGNGVNSDNALTITLGSAVGKFAGAYTLNGTHAAAINGNAAITVGVSIAPTETGSFRLGAASGGTGLLNGHIRRIGYYNTRLPNATLQALTTT